MTDLYKDVAKLHEYFEFPRRQAGEKLDQKLVSFRLKFLLEELNELALALKYSHLPDTTDALVDLVYVALGTAWLLDLPFPPAWDAVQSANMSKVKVAHAGESKRGHAFDLKKPPGWRAPDHTRHFVMADLTLKKPTEMQKDPKQEDLEALIKELDQDLT